MKPTRVELALYGVLMRLLLPREVSRNFGPSIRETFVGLRSAARRSGGWAAVAGVWAREVAQMLSFRTRGVPLHATHVPALPATFFAGWGNDFRHAGRLLLRSPLDAGSVILVLALGLGACSAIFSVAIPVFWTPLPFDDPSRLIQVGEITEPGGALRQVSVPNYRDWRQLSALEGLAASYGTPDIFLDGPYPERISRANITANLLDLLGVRPMIGRGFTESESAVEAPVAIVSHAFWQTHLNGDPDAVGRSITLDSGRYTIVGVQAAAPGRLDLRPLSSDVMTPFAAALSTRERRVRFLRVLGRLAPTSTLEELRTQADALGARLAAEYSEANSGRGIGVVPLRQVVVGPATRTVQALAVGVVVLLLIATANAAGVLTGRAVGRAEELAVRRALGAGTRHLLRLAVAEAVLLAIASGSVGLLVGQVLNRALVMSAPAEITRTAFRTSSLSVLAFAAAAAFATALFCTLLPMLGASTRRAPTLRVASGHSDTGRLVRRSLVAGQVALTVILANASGLLGSSLWRIVSVDLGWHPQGVLEAQVSLPSATYPPETRSAFFRRLARSLEAAPAFDSASISGSRALSRGDFGVDVWTETFDEPRRALLWQVNANHFDNLGVEFEEGRSFRAEEERDGVPVVVISRSAARRLFPGAEAIGKHLRFESHLFTDEPERLVVGIVEDLPRGGFDGERTADIYTPHGQYTPRSSFMHVRTALPVDAATVALRDVIASIDGGLPIQRVAMLESKLAATLDRNRFLAMLISAFAGAGLALISVAVFAVVRRDAECRLREAGIRLALGARRSELARLFAWSGFTPSLLGLAVGVLASAAGLRLLDSVVADAQATVGPVLATVTLVLLVATGCACLLGVRRAVRVEPQDALRTG